MDHTAMKDKLPERRRKLNEVDETFKLPEGEYGFDREIEVVEILRKEHSNILKEPEEIQEGARVNPFSAGDVVPRSTDSTPPQSPSGSGQGHIEIDIKLPQEHEIIGLNSGVSLDNEMV
jgi:hypothetical protein